VRLGKWGLDQNEILNDFHMHAIDGKCKGSMYIESTLTIED
jgi:hypothetical protein